MFYIKTFLLIYRTINNCWINLTLDLEASMTESSFWSANVLSCIDVRYQYFSVVTHNIGACTISSTESRLRMVQISILQYLHSINTPCGYLIFLFHFDILYTYDIDLLLMSTTCLFKHAHVSCTNLHQSFDIKKNVTLL